MNVLCMRHGIAEELAAGRMDIERELTKEGREKTEECCKGVAAVLERLDLIVSSPYARAVQTADYLAKEFKTAERATSALITPHATPEGVITLCREYSHLNNIAIVSHEPVISAFICAALTGGGRVFIDIKKAGACLLEFQPLALGGASLEWLFKPKQLRLLK